MITIDKKLKSLLNESGITQKEAAKEMGIGVTTLQGILSGKHTKRMSLRVALAFAELFEMDIYDLIEGTEYEVENWGY